MFGWAGKVWGAAVGLVRGAVGYGVSLFETIGLLKGTALEAPEALVTELWEGQAAQAEAVIEIQVLPPDQIIPRYLHQESKHVKRGAFQYDFEYNWLNVKGEAHQAFFSVKTDQQLTPDEAEDQALTHVRITSPPYEEEVLEDRIDWEGAWEGPR